MSVQTIKLTSKRQATFPAELCRELNLRPGDRLALERCEIDGTPAWVMRPASEDTAFSWFASLRPFASGKPHAMEEIRRSIAQRVAGTKS